jgi:histidinol-phosphate aminotransferase
MSRFFDLVSKPAREMESHLPSAPTPAPAPPAADALTSVTPASDAPAQEAPAPPPHLVKLDSNENPFGPSPRALEAIRTAMASANCYPDDDCSDLRQKLAEHHALPYEQVLVTAGSTALLGLLCQTMLAPGLNAVTSMRSFIVYSMAVHVTGAQLIEVPTLAEGIDLEAILKAINAETRLVFLANPNNPTGTLLEAPAVDNFLARVPGHVVVVLDEAYYEFASHFASQNRIEYSRSLDYARQGAGVVVLRTFSKAHGLAGLRVGYGLGPAELLDYCARMRNTFSVSSLAAAAAVAALEDKNHIGRVVSSNAAQAQFLQKALTEIGYRVPPTAANFVYCDVGEAASVVAGRLREEGISVRPLGAWGAPNCIRVTIGTPEQNQFFLNAAHKISGAARRAIRI